jgi:uncharacterized membrane-anchored protein
VTSALVEALEKSDDARSYLRSLLRARDDLPRKGAFVISLDSNNVATFARIYDGDDLAENEALLQYKQVDASGTIRLGAESFFFQEGQAELFNAARFGVLHVDDAGKSVLIGLADAAWQRIAVPVEEKQQ